MSGYGQRLRRSGRFSLARRYWTVSFLPGEGLDARGHPVHSIVWPRNPFGSCQRHKSEQGCDVTCAASLFFRSWTCLSRSWRRRPHKSSRAQTSCCVSKRRQSPSAGDKRATEPDLLMIASHPLSHSLCSPRHLSGAESVDDNSPFRQTCQCADLTLNLAPRKINKKPLT